MMEYKTLSLDEKITALEKSCDVEWEEVIGPSRVVEVVDARCIWIRFRRSDGATLYRIAKEVNRDHSTVVYMLKRHEDYIAANPEYRRKVKKFLELI